MLKPIITFYVNPEEPEGQRHIGVVLDSPFRSKLVGGVFVSPEVGREVILAVQQLILELSATGAIPDYPPAGWEDLPGALRPDDTEAAA